MVRVERLPNAGPKGRAPRGRSGSNYSTQYYVSTHGTRAYPELDFRAHIKTPGHVRGMAMALGSPLRLAANARSASFLDLDAPLPALPRFATGHPRRRRWFAIKVGLAAVIASLGSLVDALHDATHGFAPWAVVTVVVVMQPTLGSTLSKGVNRLVGTAAAAGAAACAGYGAKILLPPVYDQVALAIVIGAATTVFNYFSSAPNRKQWAYAYLIAYLTFDFLALQAFHEQPSASYHRVLMIIVGGLVAMLVKLLPTGESTAAAQAQGMLADALSDCAEAVLGATRAYATGRHISTVSSRSTSNLHPYLRPRPRPRPGRQLHRLESIDFDVSADDDVHSR